MGIRDKLRGSDDPQALGRKLNRLKRKAKRDARAGSRAAAGAKAEAARKVRADKRRAAEAVDRGSVKRGLQSIGGTLAGRAGKLELDGPSGGGMLESREQAMFAGAEESAMAGPVVQDATLQPVSSPEQTGALFGGQGDMAVDGLVMGSGNGTDQAVDDLLTGGAGEQANDDTDSLGYDVDGFFAGGGNDGR